MEKKIVLFSDDFAGFGIGAFPFDAEHSAMGEYHFAPSKGYCGQWFDPIADFDYRGPSWIVTSPRMDGAHFMEQMRLVAPDRPRKGVPVLRAGESDWTDVHVKVNMRPLVKTQISGFLFRYQTSMMHYGLFVVENRIEFHKVQKRERTVLASAEVDWSPDVFHDLSVAVKGNRFQGYLDGKLLLEAADDTYKDGCIALCSCIPAQYSSVKVETDEEAAQKLYDIRKAQHKTLSKLQSEHAKPEVYRIIDLKDFGAGRQIRFGHLTGTDELFFVMCQHQRRVFKDRYPFISCMTAVSIKTGQVLWQIGEPRDDEDVINLTTDLPVQLYDIDGDGIDEVICSWDFKLMILDGRTGKEKKSILTPRNVEPPESVCSLEFGKYAFDRLNVDAIRIVNVRGLERPRDILIKDRYSRIWIYTDDLQFLWKFSLYNTGHFPYAYDFNNDGKDEIFSCYNMVGNDGKLQWKLPIKTDHTDEIIVGKFDPDSNDEVLAIVSGWEGFMIVSKSGEILHRDINGHGQRISSGNFCPDKKGFEICTTTFWGNNGIIYMHDCKGNELWHKEMLCNGNLIAPVNWDGNGCDLIFLNGDPVYGGLIDGYGNVVVSFPSDGHPTLSGEVLNVTGDARDEIILWDRKRLYIYTQGGPSRVSSDAGEYVPYKYPMYNASNYRGEYSFPRWIK